MNQLIRKIIIGISSGEIPLDVCNLNEYLVRKFTPENEQKETAELGASPTFVEFSKLIFNSIRGHPEIPVIAKIFIIPPDIKDTSIYGLIYEGKVYAGVIDSIIADNLSPNFIGSFGYGKCSVRKAFNYLAKGNEQTKFTKTLEKIQSGGKYTWENFVEKARIGIILNPAVPNAVPMGRGLYHNVSIPDKINIIFQMVYSIAVMSKFRLIHNDLHAGNVLVDENKTEEAYAFIVGRKIFSFKTKYIPLIFDWDRSYSDYLGENKSLDRQTCVDWNVCNSFKNNFDLAVFLCTLGFILPDELVKLDKMYYNREVARSYDEDQEPIRIEKEEEYRIRQHVPISRLGELYKISRRQLREIFKDRPESFFDKVFPRMLNAIIKLDEDDIYVFNSFHCRPTLNLKGTLSPEDILTHTDIFDMLRVDRIPDNIPKENIFHFPTKEYVKRRINVDIKVPSTRKRIEGEPMFPIRKMSGYVKQKKYYPHLSGVLEKEKKKNYGKFIQNK